MVVGDEQDDELGHVAQVGPVVLVELAEWQVGYVVHYVEEREAEDEQRSVGLFVAHGHVHAKSHPVQHWHENVHLIDGVSLELVLELSELFLISCLYNHKNDQIEKYSQDCRESRKSIIVRILTRRILEMQAHRKRNVETAEQEQS